jgi:hypothetical protein
VTRLTGHRFEREGSAHDDNGDLLAGAWVRTSGPGRGRCECGALSESLPSGNARKAWHRDHKAQVAQAMEER